MNNDHSSTNKPELMAFYAYKEIECLDIYHDHSVSRIKSKTADNNPSQISPKTMSTKPSSDHDPSYHTLINMPSVGQKNAHHQESSVANLISSGENAPIETSPIDPEIAARHLASKCNNLESLRQAVIEFDGCPLKSSSTNTVFADGDPNAQVMFIGEAPGFNEDQQGIPFCGQSGKLLDNIILSMGLTRAQVYITNTVFWRPPDNRRPTKKELAICRPFVEKHIAIIKPKLLVLVGSTAAEALLNLTCPMSAMRAKTFEYSNQYISSNTDNMKMETLTSPSVADESIKTIVIFHPSYLLRRLEAKKIMWLDILHFKNNNLY